MPYGKQYNSSTVGTGGSQTPSSVMGGQGKPAPIKPSHSVSKPTGHTPFPKG